MRVLLVLLAAVAAVALRQRRRPPEDVWHAATTPAGSQDPAQGT